MLKPNVGSQRYYALLALHVCWRGRSEALVWRTPFFLFEEREEPHAEGRSAETRIVSRSISLAPDKDSLRFSAVRSTANR